jgi:hypothetical protein
LLVVKITWKAVIAFSSMLSGAMLAAVITPYNVLVVFKSGLFGTVILMTDVLSGIKPAISKLPD